MKRGLAIIIILLTVLSLVAGVPQTRAKTITVPNDYPTIQAAINAANNGDTIQIAAGRYYGAVIVNKSVSLIGESPATTTIYCTQETYDAYVNSGNPFDISADNVLIANLTILQANEYYAAIKATNARNVQITNNVFDQGRTSGIPILLDGCTNFDIIDNDIQGTGRIEIRNSTGGEISRNVLRNVDYAILIYTSQNLHLSGNRILQSREGIRVTDSTGTVLTGNKIDSFFGAINAISLIHSPSSVLTDNEITNSTGGFLVSESGNSRLQNNSIKNSISFSWGGSSFSIQGYKTEDFKLDIDVSNTLDGRFVYYLRNLHDTTISPSKYPNAGYIAVIASSNVTVTDFSLRGCAQGILFSQTNNSQIRNNVISDSGDGISLAYYSNGNLIYGNRFESNQNSIRTYYSSNNQIVNNDMTRSGTLWIDTSSNYTIFGNTLGGFKLVEADGITAYHNNFVNSSYYLGSHYASDEGYPTGGSYYIDYIGVDLKSGISQGLPGPDGIGDTAYYTADYYPLMAPIKLFDAGIWGGKTVYLSVESNSTISNFMIDSPSRLISFSASGNAGTIGFARVEIPNIIKSDWGGNYQIMINGQHYLFTITEGTKSDYAYSTYPNELASSTGPGNSSIIGQDILFTVALIATIIIVLVIVGFAVRRLRTKRDKT